MSRGNGFARLLLMVTLLVALGFSTSAQAQNDPRRRQEMFESLLRNLIDSRMDQTVSTQEYYVPLPNDRLPIQVREARKLFEDFSQEASRLFDILNQEIRQRPNLSSLVNATLQVKANASVLAQRSSRTSDLDVLKDDFVNLDRDWRLLSYRLTTTPGISQQFQNSIRTLDSYDQRLCSLFGVNPQIDGQEFQRLVESLEIDVRNLLDEISTELGWSEQGRQLSVMGRLVEQQVKYMAYNRDLHRSRDQAVAEYNKFQQLWGPYSSQLWTLRNRYIERGLQRIEQTDRDLQEVLWMPVTVNHRQLTRLVDVLQSDVEKLFEQTTLQDMIKMSAAQNLPRLAGEFQSSTERFATSIKANKDLNTLQVDFRMVEERWRAIANSYRDVRKGEILRLIKTNDQTILSLREGVQIRASFNRNQATQLAAALENYGKHLQEDFSRYVNASNRYDRRFIYQGLHTCQQFTAFANNIHLELANGTSPEDLRERCETLYRGWNYLNDEFLSKLQGQEREMMRRHVSQITPQVVQLRTMFEF